MKVINEKELNPIPGMLMLVIIILGIIGSVFALVLGISLEIGTGFVGGIILGFLGLTVFCLLFAGLKIVNPREALVLTLFGKYYGTIKKDGFFFVNPFSTGFNPTAVSLGEEVVGELSDAIKGKSAGKSGKKTGSKKVSTKTITLNNSQQKVNDVQGNPIIIGTIVIWRVVNPTKAVFNVENYFDYLSTQCDSTIRNIARLYPYDVMNNEDDELTLRGSSLEIAERMKTELQVKADEAGIEIQEVRITHLAYSEEIAAAMLRRQQATATVAAKEKIVEGAVGMVKMALDQLEEDEMILLDDERKAAMVSNLMVVLCSDKDAQPVVNSGSLY
ncbi:MAG: SPFH domain-containing protein [Lentihominibacter sp.]|jgi:regulator of protease activity HflC (stomatin/prohibitin superfamily)